MPDPDFDDEQLPLFGPRPYHFGGATFDPEQDAERLTSQLDLIYHRMRDHQWHTLADLAHASGGSEASASARVRDLRKERFGSHTVLRKRVEGGLYAYKLEART
jgi:hypothetical protein